MAGRSAASKIGTENTSRRKVIGAKKGKNRLTAQGTIELTCAGRQNKVLEKQLDLFHESKSTEKGWSQKVERNRFRLDTPRRGHVLATIAEEYGKPIREAVRLLSNSFDRNNLGNLARVALFQHDFQSDHEVTRSDEEIAAWTAISVWIVAVSIRALPTSARLADAESWFFGEKRSGKLTGFWSAQVLDQAQGILQTNPDVTVYHELLPYILDPHGPGSRLSVKRDPASHVVRMRKRAEGVFYTPADVAEYMVHGCLSSVAGKDVPTIFDPACGTGVFLRAALKELRLRYREEKMLSLASQCLFGADIDPWPLYASAFVLLADICVEEPVENPVKLWHKLGLNLRCFDTLRIDPADANTDSGDLENTLKRISICDLFPELKKNPTVIVGNPPYAHLGSRPDLYKLGQVFRTLAIKAHVSAEIYTLFVEQMIRLTQKGKCAGALVLPLSIACNIGPQFVTARKLMQETPGHWKFAFFDREPHALFGEDVKTRNTIIFWSRKVPEIRSNFASGPLRKWRSNSRAEMFSNIQFTEFDGDIRTGIPKVDGAEQAEAWYMLSSRWSCLEQAVQGIQQLSLAETLNSDDRTVFVGSTAYNFLNVFLRPPPASLEDKGVLSENPLHAIRCATSEDSLIVFSILTSNLAYWWWHICGDGFHVSKRFIREFPCGLDVWKQGDVNKLYQSGRALWLAMKGNPIVSINRGRTSLSYSPNCHSDMRRCADEILVNAVGLDHRFVDELRQFTTRTVTANS